MDIKILPPQLANQIAAGEVVERPASVVKELIENSLDAGASRIEIDIEQGGAKRIAIRDNGKGINKDQLALALSRHATSKIDCLEDLEAIVSLGFRGEALASISSVSRLTLTSRPEAQSEGWQAYAEGRDMQVIVKPAAHPCGTSLEVLDLFYNTPARRKFLRTEKTEFAHIDEVVRRIALARFDVHLTLRHNGKLIRQYRAASDEPQQEKRLVAICGPAFLQHSLKLQWQHEPLSLEGWVATPDSTKNFADLQYFYVNGRMMRDRLINHAIRQAYQDKLGEQQLPAYVLYLKIDPRQVDVNVHPAKHEVRFHQSRLVHDFIYQGVLSALQNAEVMTMDPSPPAKHALQNRVAAGGNIFATPQQRVSQERETDADIGQEAWRFQPVSSLPSTTVSRGGHYSLNAEIYRKSEGENYQQLLSTDNVVTPRDKVANAGQPSVAHVDNPYSFGRVLTVYQKQFALVEKQQQFALVFLSQAERALIKFRLTPQDQDIKSQPLLIPLRLKAEPSEKRVLQYHQTMLSRLGIDIMSEGKQIIVSAVPLPLRTRNLQKLIPEMLHYFVEQKEYNMTVDRFLNWLVKHSCLQCNEWNLSQAIALLAELESQVPNIVQDPPAGLLSPVVLTGITEALIYDSHTSSTT